VLIDCVIAVRRSQFGQLSPSEFAISVPAIVCGLEPSNVVPRPIGGVRSSPASSTNGLKDDPG
jgi:hypothetical protein